MKGKGQWSLPFFCWKIVILLSSKFPGMKSKNCIVLLLLFCALNGSAQTKILFDCGKAETAGNADWVVDADVHNMYWGPFAQLSGTESNGQRFPTPAQSGITSSTPETYWTGALSYWGIDCVKQGYTVESLPYTAPITYGSTTNPQDLSNYSVFIVDEPNLLFTTAEKTAILNYVQNGGSLFMISDHTISDRNNSGADSPIIWNDLLTGTTVGIAFNLNSFSENSTSIVSSGADSISTGQYGTVTQVLWSDGTDLTINNTTNPTVRGVVFRNGMSNNNAKVMFAYAHYGNGKIAALGDSSPPDDGTGDPNDNLYDGYIADANGNHRKLLMNATIWLAKNTITTVDEETLLNGEVYVFDNTLIKHLRGNSPILIYDLSGKLIKEILNERDVVEIPLNDLSSGIYILRYEGKSKLIPIN